MITKPWASSIDNILALRGDPPVAKEGSPPLPKGKYFARDLVRWVAEVGGYSIGVGSIPRGTASRQTL